MIENFNAIFIKTKQFCSYDINFYIINEKLINILMM